MGKKELKRIAKLEFMAGQAKPGPALAGLGIDMGGFTKQFNDATRERAGNVVPVIINCFSDRSFTFTLKTTPASRMLLKAANIKKGSNNAKTDQVATITLAQLKEVAEYKLEDLNANDVDAAMKIIAGTAKNMGIDIEGISERSDEELLEAKKAQAASEAADAAAAADEAAAKEAAANPEVEETEEGDAE